MTNYNGYCFICGEEAHKQQLCDHMLHYHNEGEELSLLIEIEEEEVREPNWLLFSIRQNSPLEAIDKFLRKMWLEDRGQISQFSDGLSVIAKSKKCALLSVGDSFYYNYSLIETKRFKITVVAQMKRPRQRESIALLAQNKETDVSQSGNTLPANVIHFDPYGYDQKLGDLQIDQMMVSIEKIKADGDLDEYLHDCAQFKPIPHLLLEMMFEEDPDEVVQLYQIINFIITQLNQLTVADLKGYDFSGLYETYEAIEEIVEEAFDFLEDSTFNYTLPTVAQMRKNKEVPIFLQNCEDFLPFSEEFETHVNKHQQRTLLETALNSVTMTIERLEELTPFEKKGYDLSVIYEEYHYLRDLMKRYDRKMEARQKNAYSSGKKIIPLFAESHIKG